MKLIIAIVGGTILVAALLIFLPGLKPSTGGLIEVNPREIDVGDVLMTQGLIKKNYEVKNAGSGPLKVTSIVTSCHCTSAVLRMGDKTSPSFGMENMPFWSEEIPAGQTAQLEVIFDPAYHGDAGMGPVTRGIYISSNDPKNKRVELLLSANVIH